MPPLDGRPPWRELGAGAAARRGIVFQASPHEIDMVNAALYLRRPLLITGPPGVGKSSLAYAVAHELGLGEVLVWPITSRSTREHGLYSYDAVGRFQEVALAVKRREGDRLSARHGDGAAPQTNEGDLVPDIGRFIRLGPLGTAFLRSQHGDMSLVLIDELDKSDIDLPNDLLHLFEEGAFEIPEIARLPSDQRPAGGVQVRPHGGGGELAVDDDGMVRCHEPPLVIITSNGEREFPPAFLRRCLRLDMERPGEDKLREIVRRHLQLDLPTTAKEAETAGGAAGSGFTVLQQFLDLRDGRQGTSRREVATDQLLNALFLVARGVPVERSAELRERIFAALSEG